MNDKHFSMDNLKLIISGLKVGISPDWDENNENEFGYIKNRTHYTETKTLSETREFSSSTITDLEFAQLLYEHRKDAIYTVDGANYVYLSDQESTAAYVWNVADENGTTGYVVLRLASPEFTTLTGQIRFASNASITINYEAEDVHQLDEKYIPDSIAREEDVEAELEVMFTEIDSQKMNANNPVGTGSFSMGRKDGTVIGSSSHAEGSLTTASDWASHAEGYNTTASGRFSHVEGCHNIASGESSHAEGGTLLTYISPGDTKTTASGMASHAEGIGTTASGDASHAEGLRTRASGDYSHAEGSNVIASGNASHAEGTGTKATQSSQHVQGMYNIEDTEDKYVHIVGNGDSDNIRSNAHTLDWEGNAWYQGEVYVGGASQDDENTTRLLKESEIATDDEILEMLVQEDILPVVADSDGALLADESNNILLW